MKTAATASADTGVFSNNEQIMIQFGLLCSLLYIYISLGKVLFVQQGGEQPVSEGWYDTRKNISGVILSLYSLADCSTYEVAYIDGDFIRNIEMRNGDMLSCQRESGKYSALISQYS